MLSLLLPLNLHFVTESGIWSALAVNNFVRVGQDLKKLPLFETENLRWKCKLVKPVAVSWKLH